ncbi:MAG: Mov34/MPN/PAD-1 family protein [Candidatus ainarchaeum sp.]|nr:Mov34/MPN/PAD-1 family protein [Candidatus ainarchaeum sp.]
MWKIKKNLIEDVIQSAKNYYPKEFLCFLSGDKEAKEINEIVLIPTLNGDDYSSVNTYNIPIDNTILGSLHSHPNGSTFPSTADKKFFKRYLINVIIGLDTNNTIINVFDDKSNKLDIELID